MFFSKNNLWFTLRGNPFHASDLKSRNGWASEPYSGMPGSFEFGGAAILPQCAASMAAGGFHVDRLKLKLCGAAMQIATLMLIRLIAAATKGIFLQNLLTPISDKCCLLNSAGNHF